MASPNTPQTRQSADSPGYGEAFNNAVRYTMETLKIGFGAACAFVVGCNGAPEQKKPEGDKKS